AFWLTYTSQPAQSYKTTLEKGEGVTNTGRTSGKRRSLLYGLLGLCAGLALWSHLLILPCVLTAGLLLWLYCKREILSRSGLLLLVGFLIGFLPTILYNLSAPVNYDSLHALAGATQYTVSRNGVTLSQQILQTFVITLPRATGVTPACYMLEPMQYARSIADLYPGSGSDPTQCFVIEGAWGLGATMLWCIAFMVVALPLWRSWRKARAMTGKQALEGAFFPLEERRATILQCARCALLVSAALTLLLYMFSFPAAAQPRSTSRYLICLFFALPVVLWPLWHGIGGSIHTNAWLKERRVWVKPAALFMRWGLLVSIFIVFIAGVFHTWSEVPGRAAAYDSQVRLTQQLLDLGITRIYSDYWTCARLTFQSQEHLICAQMDEHLQTGRDRYTPYRDMLQATPHPSYVFQATSPQAKLLASRLGSDYQRYLIEKYVVYVYHEHL
ncbi:MAG: hypothetical protein J2P37_30955, partial [Ktedonobacteraceae bacterium]|nr:hypothetical protein [Ktedonobacteraceae bacterium]